MAAAAAIAAGVLSLAGGIRPAQAQRPAAVRVPRSVLQRYVGDYVHPAGNIVSIRLSGDTLFQDDPGRRVMLVPISETRFRFGPVFTVEFVTDQAGEVTQIATDGVAVEFRLPRKGSRAAAVPPAPPAAVKVPKSVLERYVGEYEFIPGQMSRTDLRIQVTLRGGTLIRHMGRDDILTPISETQFKVGNTSLMVEFVVDDAGVTQVLGTGGQQMLARLTTKR